MPDIYNGTRPCLMTAIDLWQNSTHFLFRQPTKIEEDDLKNEDNPKNEDDYKNEDNHQNEEDPKNEADPLIEHDLKN